MGNVSLSSGQILPAVAVTSIDNVKLDLLSFRALYDWLLIVVHKGKRSAVCTQYLQKLNQLTPNFNAAGVDVVAVSSDSLEDTQEHFRDINPIFRVGCNLEAAQMKRLGLYSSPVAEGRNPKHHLSEPGVFIVNGRGELRLIEISNSIFARPDLNTILMGISYLRT